MTVAKKYAHGESLQSCCPNTQPCSDPEKCFLQKQRKAFLESLLILASLSREDVRFLYAYFDFGPGGSGAIDFYDFAIMFGMDKSRVFSRIAALLNQLRKSAQTLGYKEDGLY